MDRPLFQLNGHRVTFWGSVGVAVTWIGFAMASPDGKILTIFQEDGREAIRTYYRYYYPAFAKKMGWDRHWNAYVARQNQASQNAASPSLNSSSSSR